MTTETIKLTLPYPPSSNRYWRKTQHGRVYVSEEAKKYRDEIALLTKRCGIAISDVSFTAKFYRPRKSGDLDNRIKHSTFVNLMICGKIKTVQGVVEHSLEPNHKIYEVSINPMTDKTIPRAWTSEEDSKLLELYTLRQRKEIAAILNRTIGSVRKRCSVLQLNSKHPLLIEEEKQIIKDWYLEHASLPIELFNLDALAMQIGRTKHLISRYAKSIGLTIKSRRRGDAIKEKQSENRKEYYKTHEHPKGMLGKNHSQEFRDDMSVRVKKGWSKMTKKKLQNRTEKRNQTCLERYGTGNPSMKLASNPYSRTKSGKREDLGSLFVRSSWEANYARYLNFLITQKQIISWEYESKTFVFEGIKRGTLSYTPDFRVLNNDASHEWHEVKGWMDATSKTRLKRFAKFFPNEKLVLIDAKAYKEISQYARLIPNWE